MGDERLCCLDEREEYEERERCEEREEYEE